ncbi:hypothetical protein KIN20_023396 [Parelaphostrongylus tenuis]|uniref:Uncharacterized protein n=1 Tax=Parelaphostrongylus tenuis TaxID=148309 RepID=A0AAD5N908_PARTN|nr:hypothetical protein KIN20_023396 [Parelaphostrongylus tenuis]
MIEENSPTTWRMLADEAECCFKTIANILHELGKKVWRKLKWVEHELTEALEPWKRAKLAHHARGPDFLDDEIACDDRG